MKKWAILIMTLLICVAQAGLAFAADDLAAKLQQLDTIYEDINNPERLTISRTLVDELMAKNQGNYQVVWRAARYYDALGQTEEKPLATFERGQALAELAVQLAPAEVEGHFWYALLLGKVGQQKGIFKSLSSIKAMIEELEKCVELKPDFPDSYHIMGLLYMQAPGWPVSIGDKDKSIQYNQKAVTLQPGNFAFQWGLFMAYDHAGKKKEAKDVLNRIITMPVEPQFEKFADQYKTMAGDELKKRK